MDVPKPLRGLAGTTSWKKSLQTTDKRVADIKRAELTSFYKAEILRLEGQLAGMDTQEARDMVDRALEILAARKGSLDAVVRAILTFMTLRARQSWGRDHEREAEWDFGLIFDASGAEDDSGDDEPDPFPGFDTNAERDAYVTRQRLLERRGLADGITLQEVAQRLLDRQAWSYVEMDLLGLLHVVGAELKVGSPKFDAAAEHLLRRLAGHQFGDWQSNIREAIAPAAAALPLPAATKAIALTSAEAAPAAPAALVGKGHPISEVLHDWQTESKATLKSKDEFGNYLQKRFIGHFGDVPVELITKKMVIEWKKLLHRLPPQPKAAVAKLPPSEQAEYAEAHQLRRISGKTVIKHLQALRSVLSHAKNEMLILGGELVTEGVTVDLADEDELEILPFDENQMAHIFSQPVMTNPDAGDDDVFWFLLLAPFSGCRIEEKAKLRPGNIRAEKQIPFIAIERDRLDKRQQIAAEGGIKKRLKTRNTTKRNIPVHWILQEAGFLEFVQIMADRGAEWLFADLSEFKKYDQRGKYMSNKLMRVLRRMGITDRENVYHSFRHTLKRELRDDEKTKEEISDLLTGHSFSESVGRKYARGAGLKTLAAAVNRVDYDTVDWDKVVATGRARVARMRCQMAA